MRTQHIKTHLTSISSHVLHLASCLFGILLLYPISTSALSGHVVNKTLSRPEANVVVSYIHHAQGNVIVLRDTTDQTGQFSLGVPTDIPADPPPMLLAKYNNIDYPGNPAPKNDIIEIPVYETTDQDTAISLASHHALVDFTSRQVTYILIVNNSGNRTYLSEGDHGHGLELPLPDGVTDILQAPEGVHLHGNVVVDPRPIVPGQSQSFFTFALPASNRLDQTITYPTNAFDLLIQPPETQVTTTGLHDHGPVNFSGQTFRQFAAASLTPGSRIGIQFVTEQGAFSQNALIGALAILAVAFGIAAIYFARRPRIQIQPLKQRTALLEQMADLDDRFEHGNISEKVYRRRRDALKAEVAALLQDRQTLLGQIADLDEQFEQGQIDQKSYHQRRNALKNRVSTLTDQG